MADPIHVAARSVLLDALFALAPHGPAIILVGAQAVYLRTGHSDLTLEPYTIDGDLVINPTLLGEEPELEAAMREAGFELLPRSDEREQPGIWSKATGIDERIELIPVDLIVPDGVAPSGGRRGARLGTQGNRAARKAVGLEAALIDHSSMTVSSLDPADTRSIEVEIAGPAALLVAKLHKLHDRMNAGKQDRLDDKDASDVVRIMQTIAVDDIAPVLARLLEDSIAGGVTRDALTYLDELFGRRGRPGIVMAARAMREVMAEETVEVISTRFAEAVIAGVRREGVAKELTREAKKLGLYEN